jgi:lambda repressor-like predicted transcriptional regulator
MAAFDTEALRSLLSSQEKPFRKCGTLSDEERERLRKLDEERRLGWQEQARADLVSSFHASELSLREFALRLGVHHGTLDDMLKGRRPVQGWIFSALPSVSREAHLRHVRSLLEKTGT